MDDGDSGGAGEVGGDAADVDGWRGSGLRLRFLSDDGEDERGRGERERILVRILVDVSSMLSRDRNRL